MRPPQSQSLRVASNAALLGIVESLLDVKRVVGPILPVKLVVQSLTINTPCNTQ